MQNLPEKLYLAEQARELDRIAIEEKGFSGINLMRKAGDAVFQLQQKYYPLLPLAVFCGAGNNAGDGYVVARLALLNGVKVKVFYLQKPEQLKGDALIAYQGFVLAGGNATEFDSHTILDQCVIIDAIFGTGLNRSVTGAYAEAITLINDSAFPVISVDIPSGLNADTGGTMGHVVKADYTVTFIALKQGMFTGFAANYCGKISYDSLNISESVFLQIESLVKRITHSSIPKRARCAHKGNNGHVLVVGGDFGFSGAIRLAAEAALRVGAGLVSVATRKSNCRFINSGRPELMCYGIKQVKELLHLLDKATVVVIGPGLGQSQWGQDLLDQVLVFNKPMVIDADGLNLLAKKKLYHDDWVLTPHPGEAARLLECSTDEIAKDRFDAVSKLQKQYGGTVALKGVGTLVHNGHTISLSTTGNPGMASGGMGDVLSGMIGGLIAQKIPADIATNSAVYIHGKAADLSAQRDGEIGLLASDLMPFIRKLVNE